MLSEQERTELTEQLEKVNAEVRDLRKEVQVLHKDKESWITKKNSIRQDISNIIKDVKGLKEARNELTSKVQENKGNREEFDKTMKDLQTTIDELKVKRDAAQDKLGLKKPIGILQKDIKAMQDKVETIPMSFNAEKKLMQQIKDIRKQLKGADGLLKIQKELREKIQEFNKNKRIRDNSNSKLKSIASHSQAKHKSMLAEAEKIDVLREEEKVAHESFKVAKEKYSERNTILKEKLNEIKEINVKLGIEEKETRKKQDKAARKSLEERRREAEAKMMNGEKLTTEDLLVMQG